MIKEDIRQTCCFLCGAEIPKRGVLICKACLNKFSLAELEASSNDMFIDACLAAITCARHGGKCRFCPDAILCHHRRQHVYTQSIYELEKARPDMGKRKQWSETVRKAVDGGINLMLDVHELKIDSA